MILKKKEVKRVSNDDAMRSLYIAELAQRRYVTNKFRHGYDRKTNKRLINLFNITIKKAESDIQQVSDDNLRSDLIDDLQRIKALFVVNLQLSGCNINK